MEKNYKINGILNNKLIMLHLVDNLNKKQTN